MFDMSLEIQLVGVCGLSALGEHRLFQRVILATISTIERVMRRVAAYDSFPLVGIVGAIDLHSKGFRRQNNKCPT